MQYVQLPDISESNIDVTDPATDLEFFLPFSTTKAKRKQSSIETFYSNIKVETPNVSAKHSCHKGRVKSVGRLPNSESEKERHFFSFKETKEKPRIKFELSRKISGPLKFSDDESGINTIDLSRSKREDRERDYEGGGASIMATALTAAAFSGYILVKSFKAFFV